ncbi:hypothetical protein WJX72_009204 [[Myrmecia] bisecta]|uniref:Dienelactone hydrolase domain-containing protein n=1 Tax=[Myrmecia] bisecta TaxID=41462 RepID=A0AAW1Q1I5_9CHLO
MAEEFRACCASDHVWQGTPAGQEGHIGGVHAYIAQPGSTTDKAIVVIPDVFGHEAKNTRLGDNWTADRDRAALGTWMAQFPKEGQLAILRDVISDLKTKHGIKHIGAIGFCWGGRFTVLLAGSGEIDAGVVVHGSRITLEEVEAIQKPILFLFADNDRQIPAPFRKQIEETLPKLKAPAASKFYPGTEHGFGVRGDLNDQVVLDAANDAFAQALQFFKSHLGADG